MAHGWDSYYLNLPSLSSDPRTLRGTSESEGSLSEHLENFIGHHDFTETAALNDTPATNSNFNTNYYSNATIGNSSSDCVYQRYYRETPWQADGEQMEKEYLPSCGNSDISGFATDGLSASGSFPSSFSTELQGLKQDCGMLATSFLEDYSDVSSCSDADVGETRPSCKFMASNSFSKPKSDVSSKPHSSEWLFSQTGNMFPTESNCSTMSKTNVLLPSPSDVKAQEMVECSQDKMESPEKSVKSHTEHNQSFTPVEARSNSDGSWDQKQKENVESDLMPEKHSDISIYGHERSTDDRLVECPVSNDEEQVIATAPNVLSTFSIGQDHFNKTVLRKEVKESFNLENEGCDGLNPTFVQNETRRQDEEDNTDILKSKTEESGSSERETFDEQSTLVPNLTDSQDESMHTDFKETGIKSDNSESSDPPNDKVSKSNDATNEPGECMDTANNRDVESCLQLSKHQSHESVPQDNIASPPEISGTSDNNVQRVASHAESCLQSQSLSTDINTCVEKDWTGTEENSNATSPEPNCSDSNLVTGSSLSINTNHNNHKNEQSVSDHPVSSLQTNISSTGLNLYLEKERTSPLDPDCSSAGITSDIPTVDTSDKKEKSVPAHPDFRTLVDNSTLNTNACLGEELTSPPKKTTTSPTDPDCSDPDVTSSNISINCSNNTQQSVADHLESHIQPDNSNTDCSVENEWNNPSEKTNTSLSTDPDSSSPVVTSDSNEQTDSYQLEPCLQSNAPSTDPSSSLKKEWTSPAANQNATSPAKQQLLLNQTPPSTLEPQHQGGDVAENARASFEECDTSLEGHLVPDMLYGEPLSREDSSCDTDETRLGTSKCKETTVVSSDGNSVDYSERQIPQLRPFKEMTKQLQPVVILKTLESVHGQSNSYLCKHCQHTTYNVDSLIEHHHRCHSVHDFLFCRICNVYLVSNEQAEKHSCDLIQKESKISSKSSLQRKRKQHGRYKCIKCKLIFSKAVQHIRHMRTHTGKTPYKCNECLLYFAQAGTLQRHKRIPGRCKPGKLQVTNSDAATTKTKKTPQKDLVQSKPYAKLPECYVKLVDISKTHVCSSCGKSFVTAEKTRRHFNALHKRKISAVSSTQCTTKHSGVETQKDQKESEGKYKCPLCPRLFKYSYNRARHLRDCVRYAICDGKEKVAGKYRCPLCRTMFTLSSNRYRHIKAICLRECLQKLAKERAALLKPKFEQKKTRDHGQKTLSKENERKTHFTVNKQKTLPKESEQKTPSKEDEQKNQECPSKTAPKHVPRYKCNLCPAVFYHASGKYRHMKKHELFKLTGKMFRYRNSVFSVSKPSTVNSAKAGDNKDNLKSPEAKSSHVLNCHFCGKYFSTPQSLKKHQRNHRGERPYRCLECGKGFKKHAHLIGHKNVHQRRIQCTVCKKILPTIGELIQHRSSHLKRGKLQCPDCDQQFQYPVYLLRHLDSHRNREHKAQLEQSAPLKPQKILESVQEHIEQLQCSLCKEVFDDAQVLRKHCLTHISGSSSNQCPFCKHRFTNRRYLLRHMIKHTGDKPFSCTNCGKQFYRKLYLKLHSERCLPAQKRHFVIMEPSSKTKRPYRCSLCPRSFCKKIRLKSHLRGHKTNSLILCSRCGQYFGFRKLNQHQRYCGGTTEINTGSSNGSLSKSSSQTIGSVHKMPVQSNATKILPFKCSYCTQKFKYKSLLLRHLVSHTGVQPYACMHCGHRYGSQTMCLQHEAFCDGVYKGGPSKGKSDAAADLSSMPVVRETAQKQAEGETEYKCKFCTKTFLKSRNLRRHILTHNEVKPYRCKACDSCFSRYDHLKVHQTRCKGKRARLEVCIPKISLDDVGIGWQSKFSIEPTEKQETFECKDCSRSFSSQSKLSRHVTMFHVVKLFKCTHCGSSFAHEKSLKKHRKMNKCRKVPTDTNASLSLTTNPSTESVAGQLHGVRNRILQRIKPCLNKKYKYVCSYCPRAFGNSWQLRVHTRLHTGEKPYACEYCGQRFIRKDYVQRHFPKCTKKNQQSKVLCDRCGGFFSKVKLEGHKKKCISSPSLSKSTNCQSQQSGTQSPPKGFSCAYCTSRFLLFSQLQEHFLNAHKLETVVPPVSTAPLQHHLSNILNIKEEPLDEICVDRLSHGDNLICKLDTAIDAQQFFCPECNMSFISKAGLTGHMRVHTMDHPFSCKTCKRGFWNRNLLRNHNKKCRFGRISGRSTTTHMEAPLKAEIDFALNDSVLVFKEGSTETGTGVLQTNFSCKDDLLEESSKNSDGNQAQSSSNKEKKPVQYQCSECDKSFTDGLLLISHLEEHGRQEQEKKRNTCVKCGRVCVSQASLEKHLKTHGFDQEYPCPDCPKISNTLADLEIHRTYHDPNRPYLCKLCNQRFWTRPSLCNHYSKDHTDEAFTCRFCNKAYSVKKSLARHIRKWHQKEKMELASTVKESNTEQQSSSQVSTTGQSDEDENNGTEDSDSDSAPYFPCHVCGKTFKTSESLEDHQRCHLGEKPHECEECGRCFFQASQLQQHQRMHKSEFQCQACGRGFVSLFALRKHKHTHGKSRPYRCSNCHLSFTGPSQLSEHMTTHREENFPCDICNRVFLSKSSRAEHWKSHSSSHDHPPPSLSREEYEKSPSPSGSSSVFTKELKYRCGVCNDRFRDPEELSEHGCMAAKERPYSCSDCNKHFLHASHLKKHRTTHQQSSSEYPCNHCNSGFSSSQHFLSHLNTHVDNSAENKCTPEGKDGGPSRRFICPVCHQYFACATELIGHFPTHSTFECKICNMTFSSATKLEEHHCHLTSATEFECTECGQTFLGSDAFRQHRCSHQYHATMKSTYSNTSVKLSPPTYYQAATEEEEIDVTGDDLYNCPHCSMQFSSKSGLLEHQNKQHMLEKPFKCELCGKTFALRRYLKEHERRHRLKLVAQSKDQLPEIKFRCTQCAREFSTSQDLSLHMRLHAEHEAGKFRCDMCYKSFSRWTLLKQHQESHVGEVVYECTECDKAFAFPHLLEEHQQTHAGSSQ